MFNISKVKPVLRATALFVLPTLVLLVSPVALQALDIAIEIAPQVLNIQSGGTVVTVHTGIAFWSVDVHSVSLNGVEISSWKADNRGNFVAKFHMDEIKALDELAIGDYNTLRLEGVTTGGEPFEGEAEIVVIDVIPKRR